MNQTRLITYLNSHEIFVFGSNEAGIHGRGAAKQARLWGAKIGIGEGISGQTYAIPTKDRDIKTLPISKIKKYVDNFISFAKDTQSYTFLVTEIGCGLAGYKPEDIAPLFKEAMNLKNITLPRRFIDIIEKNK